MMAEPALGAATLQEPPAPEREPVASTHDAVVGLTPANQSPQYAFAIVKFAHRIDRGYSLPDSAEPLAFDLRDEESIPRLVPGSDFHLWKGATDVVVEGSVFAPGGRPTPWMDVGLEVGGVRKLVRVFGDREVSWVGEGRVRFSPPEPFQEIPLSWSRAYGGVDWRVEVRDDDPRRVRYLSECDHPGMNPRNPFGRGYVVEPKDPGERVLLPNLEDPSDLLAEDRFLVRDPALWYRQPIPWNLGWVHPFMWPRCVYFFPGVDAWYPGPDDASMPEVARGLLEPGYRRMMAEHYPGGMHPRFVQEASHGLALEGMTGQEDIKLWNLHPDLDEMRFQLPWKEPPRLVFDMDGRSYPGRPRLHHVVLRPGEGRVLTVWVALQPTPRTYLPGIHRHIPLAVWVQGEGPVVYETPPTVRDQIDQARASVEVDESEMEEEGDVKG